MYFYVRISFQLKHYYYRLHQANESGARQFSARFIQGNQLKVEQQAGLHTSSHSTSNLHSIHPSIKLMEGLSRSSLVSASGNNTVLDHHALHPAHALHGNQNRVGGFPTGMTGLVEQHQQRLTVEQQIDLLQQEALKRSTSLLFCFLLFLFKIRNTLFENNFPVTSSVVIKFRIFSPAMKNCLMGHEQRIENSYYLITLLEQNTGVGEFQGN